MSIKFIDTIIILELKKYYKCFLNLYIIINTQNLKLHFFIETIFIKNRRKQPQG